MKAEDGKTARDERLVKALRDNLRRRRAVTRERSRSNETEGAGRLRTKEVEPERPT